MKKAIAAALFLLVATILAGCAASFNEETTIFNSLQVEREDDAIVSEGQLKIHKTTATLITVEVSENTTGLFHITYTKDKGALKITQKDKEILSLEKEEASDITSDVYEVELTKGRNDFVISGEDCTCEYSAVLQITDASKIESFGGGSLK